MLRPVQAVRSCVSLLLGDEHDDRTGFACVKFAAASVLTAAVATVTISVAVGDVRDEQILDRRGVTTEATFKDTYCGKCSSLPVTFTTREGRTVTADVAVTGDPDDDTIVVRYDPQLPTRVHPANGVVADEVESSLIGVAAIGGFGYAVVHLVEAVRMFRTRRRSHWPASTMTGQTSHVKVVSP